MNHYTFVGKTEQEALSNALEELSLREEDIFYHVVEQKSGLFKAKKIEISVIKKEDIHQYLKDLIIRIVTAMGMVPNVEMKVRDDILNLVIYSDNNSLLIGRDGKNMSALSTVVRQALYNELGFYYKFNLDVGEYKVKQQKNLERMAYRVAKDVARSKIEAKLEPMNSYERRIIHNALTNDKFVTTESVGEEPNRCVVIKLREKQ